MKPSPDAIAWVGFVSNEDLWVFDKLIVARYSGHVCGPAGVDVPNPGNYFVKPVMNINGMGTKARVEYLEHNTKHLHPGEFWCEVFTGEHLSIDYEFGKPVLSVVGVKHGEHPYSRFIYWEKTSKTYPLPTFLKHLTTKYKTINCEFINGKLIEVHLRGNPDFAHGNTCAVPVWFDEADPMPKGYTFISDEGAEEERLGIWVN
jgi:hypothetical protein